MVLLSSTVAGPGSVAVSARAATATEGDVVGTVCGGDDAVSGMSVVMSRDIRPVTTLKDDMSNWARTWRKRRGRRRLGETCHLGPPQTNSDHFRTSESSSVRPSHHLSARHSTSQTPDLATTRLPSRQTARPHDRPIP